MVTNQDARARHYLLAYLGKSPKKAFAPEELVDEDEELTAEG
jgi:hypothetical protein